MEDNAAMNTEHCTCVGTVVFLSSVQGGPGCGVSTMQFTLQKHDETGTMDVFLSGDWASALGPFIAKGDTVSVAGGTFEDDANVLCVKDTSSAVVVTVSSPSGRVRTLRTNNVKGKAEAAQTRCERGRYTKLGDICREGSHSFYGVIAEGLCVTQTRGGDLSSTVHLIDETCPELATSFEVRFFSRRRELFPATHCVGTIMRVHDVSITSTPRRPGSRQRFLGFIREAQLKSVVLVDGTPGAPLDACFTDADKPRIEELRAWAHTRLSETPLFVAKQDFTRTLRTLPENRFFDIICRVLAVDERNPQCVVLSVWDGSGDVDMSIPHPSEWPSYGSVVPVTIESRLCTISFTEGLWIRLRNVCTKGYDRRLSIHVTEHSSVIILPSFAKEVTDLLSGSAVDPEKTLPMEENGNTGLEPYLEDLGDIRRVTSVILHEYAPITPLEVVKTEAEAGKRFRCRAHVVNFWPKIIENFTRPLCQDCLIYCEAGSLPSRTTPITCFDCGKEVMAVLFQYFVVLQIADSTGMLPVVVCGDEGTQFFHGIPPCNLHENNISASALRDRFMSLFQSHIQVDFCLMPVANETEGDTQQPRMLYRVFDTILHYVSE